MCRVYFNYIKAFYCGFFKLVIKFIFDLSIKSFSKLYKNWKQNKTDRCYLIISINITFRNIRLYHEERQIPKNSVEFWNRCSFIRCGGEKVHSTRTPKPSSFTVHYHLALLNFPLPRSLIFLLPRLYARNSDEDARGKEKKRAIRPSLLIAHYLVEFFINTTSAKRGKNAAARVQ